MLVIDAVEKFGIAKELKLKKGDAVVGFDGYPAVDILDYLYYDAKEFFTMTVKPLKGEEVTYEIEKSDDETLGLVFKDDGLSIKTCRNDCIFCFVAQMPDGMRESLYVKDDDYRQSFLCGNFVTLTNLTEEDVARIIRQNISPLYISVHSMDGEIRKKMLNNRFADKIQEYISVFAGHGIRMQTQVVLVQGVNDGENLDYTVKSLFKYYPYVENVAVVPCGITKYREGLTKIEDITKEYAVKVTEQADRLNEELGKNFVVLADEFYLRAEKPVKPYEFYGEFTQIENGVGSLTKFKQELQDSLQNRNYSKTFLTITGTSAYEFISQCAKQVEEYCTGVTVHVISAENKFFGSTVNCSGLLVGEDVLNAINSFKEEYDEIVLPGSMFKEFEDVFLDGMTVEELSLKTGKPIRICRGGGAEFFDVLTTDVEV